MTTRDGINQVLRAIGNNGLSEFTVDESSATKAISRILGSNSYVEPSIILKELKRQYLVDVKQLSGAIKFNLTPAGVQRLLALEIDEIKIAIPNNWDGIWRMVSFDVPLRFAGERTAFTKILKQHGFMMLHKSVWIHPANCLVKVQKIANFYNLARYCSFAEIDALDQASSRRLMSRFKLK